jgi:hypothetical protein
MLLKEKEKPGDYLYNYNELKQFNDKFNLILTARFYDYITSMRQDVGRDGVMYEHLKNKKLED